MDGEGRGSAAVRVTRFSCARGGPAWVAGSDPVWIEWGARQRTLVELGVRVLRSPWQVREYFNTGEDVIRRGLLDRGHEWKLAPALQLGLTVPVTIR